MQLFEMKKRLLILGRRAESGGLLFLGMGVKLITARMMVLARGLEGTKVRTSGRALLCRLQVCPALARAHRELEELGAR
jgi:hypothetical protein